MNARFTTVPIGDGPFCPYCGNSSAEYKANPETFDIHDHVQRCAYQPRYCAYAAAHGLSPCAMSRHDRKRHPCAPNLGFILWVGEQWRTWGTANRRARPYTVADHVVFDAWLESWCFVRQAGMKLEIDSRVTPTTHIVGSEHSRTDGEPRVAGCVQRDTGQRVGRSQKGKGRTQGADRRGSQVCNFRKLQVGDCVEVSTASGVWLGKVEGFVAGDVGETFTRPSVRTDSGRLFVGCHPEYVRRVKRERAA